MTFELFAWQFYGEFEETDQCVFYSNGILSLILLFPEWNLPYF